PLRIRRGERRLPGHLSRGTGDAAGWIAGRARREPPRIRRAGLLDRRGWPGAPRPAARAFATAGHTDPQRLARTGRRPRPGRPARVPVRDVLLRDLLRSGLTFRRRSKS